MSDPIPPVAGRVTGHASRWAGYLASFFCLALVLLMVGLVVAAAFGESDRALLELKWHLFGAMFLFGMAECLRVDGHVRVDVLAARFPPRMRAWIEFLALLLLVLPACTILVVYGILDSHGAWVEGEGSRNPGGLTNRWVIRAAIPAGFGLLGLQALARCVDAGSVALGWVAPRTDEEGRIDPAETGA